MHGRSRWEEKSGRMTSAHYKSKRLLTSVCTTASSHACYLAFFLLSFYFLHAVEHCLHTSLLPVNTRTHVHTRARIHWCARALPLTTCRREWKTTISRWASSGKAHMALCTRRRSSAVVRVSFSHFVSLNSRILLGCSSRSRQRADDSR